MTLQGGLVALRAVEPQDIDTMYLWENDPATWEDDTTREPLSRHALERFVEEQRYDIFQTRQQRLMIVRRCDGRAVGCIDLFEVEPLHCRAGVGILIYRREDRRRGYATEALALLAQYARDALRIHQLWCEVATRNTPSLGLFAKGGFLKVGIKHDWVWSAEGYCDTCFMQKIL